jgi:class 3 adenylate cyclase
MEREIRYCTTEDGVRIAYCVEGDGPTTILALPAFIETFSLDHLMPVYKQFYSDLGAGRRVIRFDWRGTGLSTHISDGATLVGLPADLAAVARAAGQACVVWAPTISGRAAVEFAVAHPELVNHLVLYGTFAAQIDAFSQSLLDGFRELAKADWQLAAQTIADTNGRREYPEEAAQLGDWYYRSMSSDAYSAMSDPELANPRDVSDMLSLVRAPTLVLHRIADPIMPFSAGQKLAAGIPGARFVPLEGKGHLFCLGDYSRILASVDALLGDRASAESTSAHEASGTFRAVLFTDLVGHTQMMSRLGDHAGRAVLREHETITREVLKANGGTEVKTMGDGFMASFASVTKAVECAIALQRAFADRDNAVGAPLGNESGAGGAAPGAGRGPTSIEPLYVRVGLNAGEPIEEDGDLFGATVILASRIAAKADGGEILVADTVRGLCSGKGFLFSDRGEFVAKGFEEPVRVYEVRWRG